MIECWDEGERWQSILGLFTFIGISWAFSADRWKIAWRPVVWGCVLQWVFAYFILKTKAGEDLFDFLGESVQTLLAYTTVGSQFVFGEYIYGQLNFGDGLFFEYTYPIFATNILTTIVMFAALIQVLYYLGLMQMVISGISWVMQFTLGTSAAESLSAAGNIFVGMIEAPLLVKPFLDDMTESEIFSVMTGGLASIAGSVL